MHEKTMTPRSCLKCKPMGKIFKTIGLRWIPTGKIFTSSTTKEFWYDEQVMTSDHNSSELKIHYHSNEPSSLKLVPKVVPPANKIATSQQELELIFSPMYEEYFNAGNQSVLKSSALSDNSKQQDTQPTTNNQPTTELITPTKTSIAKDNIGSNTLSWKPHQGGSSKLNLPDHRYKRRCCSLIPAESDSLPHAHAQTTKTYYKHQDLRIKKAQRADAKYEHVGQETKSQDYKDDQDKHGKDLKISELKTKSKDNDKGSRSKITKHEGTSLQQDKDQDKDKSLTTKAISLIS
ncbi:hypothetical protein Tco_0410236 [Tanacetum coccineum]